MQNHLKMTMTSNNTKTNYNTADIVALSYLTLPLVIFIFGWIKLQIALPLIIFLVVSLLLQIKRSSISPLRWDIIRNKKRELIPSLFIVVAILFIAGLTGNWQQHNDYLIRNDIFIDLITKSWPPALQDGKYFIYYFQSWLPASLVGALAGWKAAQWAYYLWMVLGMLIVLYYTYRAVGRVSYWIALLFIVWNGLELLPCSLIAPFTRDISFLEAYHESNHVAEPFICFSPGFSLRSISHCFVPIAIICGMLLKQPLAKQWGVFIGVCAVLYSPMAAIFLLPCLVYLYLKSFDVSPVAVFKNRSVLKKILFPLFSPLSIASYLIFAFVIAPFYLSAESVSTFTLEHVSFVNIFALAFYLFWNVGVATILIRIYNKDNLIWVALVSHALCMFASLCYNSDMAMKGSAICNYYLLILFIQAVLSASQKHKRWYIIYAIAGCACILLINCDGNIILINGAAKIAIASLLFYGMMFCPRKIQAFCVLFIILIASAILYLKPVLRTQLIDTLAGKKVLYSKQIGIYQADGGSGRWWWYKQFPPKEKMPFWFKSY